MCLTSGSGSKESREMNSMISLGRWTLYLWYFFIVTYSYFFCFYRTFLLFKARFIYGVIEDEVAFRISLVLEFCFSAS